MDGWVADGEPWRPAAWSRNGDQILATVHQGRARLVQGDTSWVAYEFKVQVTVTEGFGFQIWFGLDGPMAYHLAWLGGWKAMALIDDHHDKLDVVNATA